MSKIATYSLADSPLQLSDRLIGTEALRTPPSITPLATKNFSLGELLQLFSSNFPAATLQAVLNAGNIATQDITLTGTIYVDLIKPTNIEDMLGSQGTPFQVLSKAIGGFNWVDPPASITLTTTGSSGPSTLIGGVLNIPVYTGGSGTTPTLQQVTDEGNTTTNDVIVSKETGASYIQVASNNNILTLQVDSVNGTYIELNDPDTNRYGYIYSGGLAFEEFGYSNINLRDGFLTISNAAIKPYIYLQGSDGTLTGSVTIKTDLVDDTYEQQLPPKDGTFAFLDDIPTKTSDLINDGDNGTSHFITLEDVPSNLILYATTVASGIGGYNKLVSSITDPSYNTVAVDVSTGAITGTDQLIAGLITSPNIIVGNPGIFNITTIGNIRKVSGAGQAEFYFRVYKRDAGGTETLILQSSNTPQITSAIYTEFSATGLWNDGVFISTDMIVMKFYGTKVGSGSSPTYNFQFGGTQPVRSIVPVPLNVLPVLSLDELTDVTISAATNNQLLAYEASTQLWKNRNLIDILENFNRTQGVYYFEEFMGNQGGAASPTYSSVITLVAGNGTARSTNTSNRTNQQGIILHSTGTAATNFAGYSYGSSLYIGSGTISLETYVTIQTLSTVTERFMTYFGYAGGSSNYLNIPSGIFFSYDEGGIQFSAAASPNWKCYTRASGGTVTVTTTSIPVVDGQWYKLRIDINADGTSVTFYVDGALVATHTTNIPSSTTAIAPISIINKSIGTTARTMLTDYFMYKQIFTTPR